MLLYEILAYTLHEKLSESYKSKKLKYQLQSDTINLSYLMDYTLFHIFKNILSISSKNMKQWLIIFQ